MKNNTPKGVKTFTEEARLIVDDMEIAEAQKLYLDDNYVFVDVREVQEREKDGIIPNAFTCPRGMLEFLIDPDFPAHNKIFKQNKTYVFYCAGGLRSLYAAKLAFEMGLPSVKNLAGGFQSWLENNGPVA